MNDPLATAGRFLVYRLSTTTSTRIFRLGRQLLSPRDVQHKGLLSLLESFSGMEVIHITDAVERGNVFPGIDDGGISACIRILFLEVPEGRAEPVGHHAGALDFKRMKDKTILYDQIYLYPLAGTVKVELTWGMPHLERLVNHQCLEQGPDEPVVRHLPGRRDSKQVADESGVAEIYLGSLDEPFLPA